MTGIGITLIVIGSIVIAIAWNSGVNWKGIGMGALLALSGSCIGIGGNPARGAPNGYPGVVALGFMLLIPIIVLAVMYFKGAKQESDQAKIVVAQTIGGTPLDRFFVECVLADCGDFSKPKNVARAQLLADKYGLTYPQGIAALYHQGLEAHKTITGRSTANRLNDKRQEEQAEFQRLIKYAGYTGKAKTVAMLTDQMNALRSSAKSSDRYAEMLMRSGQQRERDWALWGGVADGIAGFGAGVSTALDIQRQNIQIRAQNEANMRAAMPAYMAITGNASQDRRNADAIQTQIQLLNEKLTVDIAPEAVMKKLSVTNTTVDVSETGAFKVTATVSAKEKLFIFDDVPAMADGSIMAHLYDGNQEVGRAVMVLPVNGVTTKVGIAGIGLSGAVPGRNYTVRFTANQLWMREV